MWLAFVPHYLYSALARAVSAQVIEARYLSHHWVLAAKSAQVIEARYLSHHWVLAAKSAQALSRHCRFTLAMRVSLLTLPSSFLKNAGAAVATVAMKKMTFSLSYWQWPNAGDTAAFLE